MLFGEALRFSYQALRGSHVRSLLTCLGMLIGNASVILVVTISQTSQDYILEQIRGLGSNIIYAYFETGSQAESKSQADFIKHADVEAIRSELGPRIVAATGVMSNTDRILINGKEQDVKIIGSAEVRRLTTDAAMRAMWRCEAALPCSPTNWRCACMAANRAPLDRHSKSTGCLLPWSARSRREWRALGNPKSAKRPFSFR